MRLFSEELRSGTIETSLTAPVAGGVLVVGKYLASAMFLLTMLLPTLAFVGVLAWLSRPDYGPVLSGYAGLILLGMLYLAVGALASACTSSQTLAFLGTLFGLLMLDVIPARVAPQLPEQIAKIVFMLSPSVRANDFYRGLIDTSHVAFFLQGNGLVPCACHARAAIAEVAMSNTAPTLSKPAAIRRFRYAIQAFARSSRPPPCAYSR